MENNKHLVTIVIPIYNSEPFIHRFFEALDAQTFKDFKVIFVYDHSTDHTHAAYKREMVYFSDLDIKVLHKPECEGVGKARDYAIESGLLDTKYTLFLDIDDIPRPTLLEKLVKKAEEENADVTICGYQRVNLETGKRIATEMVNNPEIIDDPQHNLVMPFINPAPWNKLIKTELIGDARFIYRGGSGEDAMFFLKVMPNCKKLVFINEVLYTYLVRHGSNADKTNLSSLEETKKGYIDTLQFYKDKGGVFNEFIPLLESFVVLHMAIGTTTRVCISNPKEKRKIIALSRKYMVENFPHWKKNKFLSFWNCIRLGFKGLMVRSCLNLYKMHMFGVFVWAYKTYTGFFKKDIKW